MKKLLLLFLLTASLSTVWAQSKKELRKSLDRDLATYLRVSLRMDYDSIYGFMPPEFFDIVNRDSITEMFSKVMDNDEFKLTMTDFKFSPKRTIKSTERYHWALVPYDASMTMAFKQDHEDGFFNLMKSVMENQFGKGNVVLEGKTMRLAMKNKFILVFKPKSQLNWYMIEDKRNQSGMDADQQMFILQSVVPKEVLSASERKK
jgi:hypothetical protein